MKTGRYSASEQLAHEETLARMAIFIRMRPDLNYNQIAEHFQCSTSMVEKVARRAALRRKPGRKPKAAL